MAIHVAHDFCVRGATPLAPVICKVADISHETGDVKAFRIQKEDGTKPFDCEPGQTAILSAIPYGECMFCVSSQGDDYIEFTVKKVGYVTEQLHSLSIGDTVGVRGPYGNWFPYEECKGKDLLFVGGGIGLAPLRSFLTYALDHRDSYGRIDLVYSASTMSDLIFMQDILHVWPKSPNTHCHVSIYKGEDDWNGAVAFTAPYREELVESGEVPRTDNTAVILCGGPSLFRTCMQSLQKLGFDPDEIVTTLEMKMKCGIGKCGRCNIGGKYICLDGPVFTLGELKDLPYSMH
jgi:NAD(P)H-flavin reductase